MRHFAILCLLPGLLLGACARQPQDASSRLTVFAAASLADAFDALAAEFEAAHPGVTVVRNYAGSSQLAAQLVEGAPADVFASANDAQMEFVVEAGLVGTQPRPFATNRLTVVVPADNPARIESLADLARPGVTLVLAVPGVPVRDYTGQVVTALSGQSGYGQTFHDAFYANLVSEEDNVRQVVAKVALGEADAGIVYASDVTPALAGQVQQVAIPGDLNVVATYPIAVLDAAPSPELAAQFVAYVLGEDGQAVLQRWGFGPKL